MTKIVKINVSFFVNLQNYGKLFHLACHAPVSRCKGEAVNDNIIIN